MASLPTATASIKCSKRGLLGLSGILAAAALLLVAACATTETGSVATAPADNMLKDFEEMTPVTDIDAPESTPGQATAYTPEQIARGKYLVGLLGCAVCHTDGALVGKPNMSMRLAGSRIGIAYTNPMVDKHPGVVYPPNLTPDPETGLGLWQDEQIVRMIRLGIGRHGSRNLPVMPWPNYQKVKDSDAYAIAAYLRSLAPVKHRVPRNVSPGIETASPYVHFGVYKSREN